jgi:hypothetical protein
MAPLSVRFLVTGDMERMSFVESVRRVLPVDGQGCEVRYLPALKVDSITSTPLSPDLAARPVPTYVSRLARKLVGEVATGSDIGVGPVDMAIAVDDLELANLGQACVVAGWLRRAVDEEVVRRAQGNAPERTRLASLVRERCSFHLLVPMAEAYFYVDGAALAAAGISSEIPSLAECDAERFRTDDRRYLSTFAVASRHAPAWFRPELHPKEYLAHLLARLQETYVETDQGAAAIRALDWSTAAGDLGLLRFARSLFEDVADFLGTYANPLGPGEVAPETWTPRRLRGRRPFLLRNL